MCQSTPLYPCGVFSFEKELYKMRLQQNKQQVCKRCNLLNLNEKGGKPDGRNR